MAVNYVPQALSLHQETVQRVEKVGEKKARNSSWVVDNVLTRYLSLIEATQDKVREQFEDEEIITLAKALESAQTLTRNGKLSLLKAMITSFSTDGTISNATYAKIEKLSPVAFLTLIELAEHSIGKKKVVSLG